MNKVLVLVALLALGCGSASTSSSSSSSAGGETTYVAPARPWAEMDHQTRQQHMVAHVLPAATDLFQGWDAERYADFSCGTCHGADASARDFAMPNPSLITLYATGTIGQEEVLAQHTEACTFMYSRLVPAVQTMLGAPAFDPATHEGFTCFSCHPQGAPDDPRSQPSPRR